MKRLIYYIQLPYIDPSSFTLSRFLFFRLLGLVYLIAFASYATQVDGLIGEQGIVPLEEFLKTVATQLGPQRLFYIPTIFWFFQGGFTIVAIAGALLALFLIVTRRVNAVLLLLLYVLYLSFQVVSGPFLSFQWDILLLEVGFSAILFALTPQKWSLLLLWLILFKLMFLSGAVKLASGDPNWRNLTALSYHYETQPLPNLVSWYIHQAPLWFHKVSTFGTFAMELAIPFLIFAPRLLRHFAAFAIIGLQIFIAATGNYTFFNLLTIALCLLLFDDQFWQKLLPTKPSQFLTKQAATNKGPYLTMLYVKIISLVLISTNFLLLIVPFVQTPIIAYPADILLALTSPLRIVNHYGLFARMTTVRDEIVIEGSNDGETWLPYEFKYKPQNLSESPKWVAPHQPRLDWQMWFASLSTLERQPWFQNLAIHLLEGTPETLSLLKTNPFSNNPPTYIRALRYEYHFTTANERAETGNWWKREYKGLYLPTTTLQDAGR